MADALERRAHQAAVRRHTNSAEFALTDLMASLARIDIGSPGIGVGIVRNATGVLAELGHALAALGTLNEMSFLVEENADG